MMRTGQTTTPMSLRNHSTGISPKSKVQALFRAAAVAVLTSAFASPSLCVRCRREPARQLVVIGNVIETGGERATKTKGVPGRHRDHRCVSEGLRLGDA